MVLRPAPRLKVCLVAADVAGSTLPRQVADPGAWIERALPVAGVPAPAVPRGDRRLDGRRDVRPGRLRPGKTLAAYRWAADRHPGHRLYFCYPTTGTATEGFKDSLYPLDLEPDERDPDAERLHALGAKLFPPSELEPRRVLAITRVSEGYSTQEVAGFLGVEPRSARR